MNLSANWKLELKLHKNLKNCLGLLFIYTDIRGGLFEQSLQR